MNERDIERIINEALERNNAVLLRQLTGYVDTRISELETKQGERFDRLETMVDAVAERVATDEIERAAMTSEKNRHQAWIGQLANNTGTALQPPLPESQ